MSKPWPTLTTDEEAERFVEEGDLSEFDFSFGKRVRFVLRTPEGHDRISITLPRDDLAQAAREAEASDTSLDDYLGQLVHKALNRKAA